ncbi:unnamed protein product [Victoria cruziana]
MAQYYEIDDIIMGEELVSVVFRVGANGVGVLDPGSDSNSVEQGAKVDLPLWLAYELYLRQAVTLNVPPAFNQKTRKEIQADPACVDLRSRCPYFYEVGSKISPLVGDRSIGSFLLEAFRGRYREVLSKAHSVASLAASKSVLSKEECELFNAAENSMASFKKWRVEGAKLEKASILGRKRKSTT